MKIVGIDTEDVRTRIHVRAGRSEGDDLVAYGLRRHVDRLPSDAEARIRRVLSDHDIERYPEGAYIGTFSSRPLEDSRIVRDHEEIVSDPYPRDIELTEFPPEEGQLYYW
ncbi:hypothetical protein [Salinigranum salinum]|uniref:hypothetical protein n=1 Tax=Salinigranum salinum TaxID=1364937 RepID=UPI00126117A8|nr:hypothetical protein [Salinigranum salinum]